MFSLVTDLVGMRNLVTMYFFYEGGQNRIRNIDLCLLKQNARRFVKLLAVYPRYIDAAEGQYLVITNPQQGLSRVCLVVYNKTRKKGYHFVSTRVITARVIFLF